MVSRLSQTLIKPWQNLSSTEKKAALCMVSGYNNLHYFSVTPLSFAPFVTCSTTEKLYYQLLLWIACPGNIDQELNCGEHHQKIQGYDKMAFYYWLMVGQ